MKLNEDYQVCDIDNKTENASIAIKINTPEYQNVVFRFDGIKIKDEDQENALLSFEYTIIDSQQHSTENLEQDERFGVCLAEIMQDILRLALKQAEILTTK